MSIKDDKNKKYEKKFQNNIVKMDSMKNEENYLFLNQIETKPEIKNSKEEKKIDNLDVDFSEQENLNKNINKNIEKEIKKKNEKKRIGKSENFYDSFLTKNSNNLAEKKDINKRKNLQKRNIINLKEFLNENILIEKALNEDDDNKNIINKEDKKEKYNFSESLIKLEQNQKLIFEKIEKMESTLKNNYNNLNERINLLENYIQINYNTKIIKDEYKNDSKEINLANEILSKGKYSETLLEGVKNDKYLYNLLSLINNKNISLIALSELEDIISRLCVKLSKLNRLKDKDNIINVLNFFDLIIKENIEIKFVNKLNIKDILQFIKSENNIKFSENEIFLLDNILNSLKI